MTKIHSSVTIVGITFFSKVFLKETVKHNAKVEIMIMKKTYLVMKTHM